ncbi:MAG TPA: glycosyltransferase family 4 protein [Terracidiphilus sp.]|nr:glycosyltransferase family 4 protein [Terracidiphilus sp.]
MRRNGKTRIAFTSHTGKVSGAERVLLDNLGGLDRERYEPFVVCPEEGDLRAAVEAENVPCIAAPTLHARFTLNPIRLARYIGSIVKSVSEVRKKILALDPDLIHANSPRAGIVATLATTGTRLPVIWHVHDILPRHPVSVGVRLLGYLSHRTRMIAVSDATAKAFSGRLPFNERMRTVHNGIDLNRFPRKAPGELTLKTKLGIPEESFLVCAVGQICARKGLLELVQAFAQSYASAPRMHIAIVGKVVFAHEKPYEEQLLRYVAQAGIGDRVHFTGEARDAAAVLRGADLLVLNSLEEPFGLVLIEAMASGTPVLAARVGGVPEIVIDGMNGWLVDKGDVDGLAKKLTQLSQSPEELARVAEIAHRTTCPRFSLDQFRQSMHGFYAEFDSRIRVDWNAGSQAALARHGSE